MKVKLGYFKNDTKQWVSLIIENIGVAQEAVKDIVGNTISEHTLHAHGLYDSDPQFVTLDTAKVVFKDICEKMYDNTPVVMNMKGGYFTLDALDWELVETKNFAVHYESSILDLLKQENGKEKVVFKEVKE